MSSVTRNAPSKIVPKLLKGWLEVPKRKVSPNLRFFRLRGYSEECSAKSTTSFQLISRHAAGSELAKRINEITAESCVSVTVRQILRPSSDQRPMEGDLGRYDYEIQDIQVLNPATANLPFLPNCEEDVDSLVRAQHRQIEMRSHNLGSALRERARIRSEVRAQLESQGFMEVETPLLFKSTPEGAREFLVPTRRKGQFFALPQSPQQYKQILMAGGIHRYYQFAKCFRDEDSRADRQLEFTQLDLEMAFVEMEDVMKAVSKIVLSVDNGEPFDVKDGDIPRYRYRDVMSRYGSDKPDLRYGLQITNVALESTNETVDVIKFNIPETFRWNNKLTRDLRALNKDLDVHVTLQAANSLKLPAAFSSIESKLSKSHSLSLLLLSRRPTWLSGGSTTMGQARSILQTFLEAHQLAPARPQRPFKLCWITDFPLFSPSSTNEPGQGGTRGLSSTHHPFTAPHPSDVHFLEKAQGEGEGEEEDDGSTVDSLRRVRGLHYDLVMNGVEIGGGSIRIHSAEQQARIFSLLGMSDARRAQFSHLLRVLGSGCPPHGGFALGFDRFVAMLCGKTSIRDVIAFPKTGGGSDVLVGSPSAVSDTTLGEYHLRPSSPVDVPEQSP